MTDLKIFVDGKPVQTIAVPDGSAVVVRTAHPGVRLETVAPDQNTEVSTGPFVFWCGMCEDFVDETHQIHTLETYRNDDWDDWD